MVSDMNRARLETAIGVVGSGTMGRGIAQWAAQAGHAVRLFDADPEAVATARTAIRADLDKLMSRGRLAADEADNILGRIVAVERLEDLANCAIVIEAIVEDLRAKNELFDRLEAIVPDSCILATNTSSLSVAAMARGRRNPKRVAGLHFFNPVPAMKVVEIVEAPATDPEVIDFLLRLCRDAGHSPVVARDMPGFIVNHAGRAFGPEGLRILSEGTADAQTIDEVMRESAGFRMGPFQLFDLIGLDVSERVMRSIYDQFMQEPRFRPVALVAQRVAAGLLGRKSGIGFYDYRNPPAKPEITQKTSDCDMPVWVSRDEPSLADPLIHMLEAAGLRLEAGKEPSEKSLILVTPLGVDATTAALSQKLDPVRTVAVDMLFPEAQRLTIMGSPAVSQHYLSSAAAALTAAGRLVSTINDSAGFVAQRIVAQIVSIGSEIAQQKIAKPEDIDLAVRLGLGYPLGPLELGDTIGPRRILTILDRLGEIYGDPCYRASLWLRRRALLDLSLRSL